MDFKLAFERLTGRHVIGPGVFWSTLGIGIVAHALGSSDLGDGNIGTRLVSVIIAHVAMMTFVYLTRLATWRLRPGFATVTLVVAGYVLAGAVRGLTLQIALFDFHVVNSGFSIYRLVGGVVVMTTGLIWSAFVFGLKSEWGGKRANLRARKQQLESLLKASESRLENEASDTMSTIESMLQTALLPELAVSPQSVLTRLQSLINDTLRPLSTALADNQDKLQIDPLDQVAARLRWSTLLAQVKLKTSSSPLMLATILAVLAVNGFVKFIPDVNPLVLLVGSFFLLTLCLTAAKYLVSIWIDRIPVQVRVPLVLIILFGVGFGCGTMVMSLAHNDIAAYALSVNGGLAAALLGSLIGVNHAATQEIKSLEQQLKNYEYRLRWTIAALNCQHWLQKKQFARKIHGPIQSEVAAAAIRIERSLSAGQVSESGEQALANLRDRLHKILADTKGTAEMRPVLAEIAETWHGLCQITFDLGEEVEAALRDDSVCVETVLEIAREACSNAIRHGSAQNIALTIDFENQDLIKIAVSNDGAGVGSTSRPGLGSAYLDDCTFQHELIQSESGTKLTATVPFRVK